MVKSDSLPVDLGITGYSYEDMASGIASYCSYYT